MKIGSEFSTKIKDRCSAQSNMHDSCGITFYLHSLLKKIEGRAFLYGNHERIDAQNDRRQTNEEKRVASMTMKLRGRVEESERKECEEKKSARAFNPMGPLFSNALFFFGFCKRIDFYSP